MAVTPPTLPAGATLPRRAGVALGLSAVWGMALLLGAVTVPVYDVDSGTGGAGASVEATAGAATLLGANGAGVLAVVGAPLLATAVVAGLLADRDRHRAARPVAWGVVAVLAGLAVLGLLTVGVFLLPAVVALAVAADARPTGTAGPR